MTRLVDLFWLVPLCVFGLGSVAVDAMRPDFVTDDMIIECKSPPTLHKSARPRTLYIAIYGLIWAAAIIPCLFFK